MAESDISTTVFCETQKFCLCYYDKKVCKKTYCPYLHRKKASVEVVERNDNEGYIVGRCSLVPLCRYFMRGYCTHAGNCRFRHEIKAPANLNLTASQSSSTNTPSTSATIKSADNSDNNSDINMNAKIIESASSTSNNINTINNLNDSNISQVDPTNWVNAPEFVPKSQKLTYADIVGEQQNSAWGDDRKKQLCPYAAKEGVCKLLPGECCYLHGDICEFCGCAALHPFDKDLRKKHEQDCIRQHEKNMELSFAIARSKDKTCGVCFETIMEKGNGEQRFGILPNCNHCFCLSCIRKWRRARQFENKIIRACPECRVTSDFVCPSIFWVDKQDDKTKLIDDYKQALSTKDCKYFEKGNGKCPFGNKCFYRHAFPDGRICDVGPPPRQRRRHITANDIEVLHQVILWDFLDERDNNIRVISDDLDDLENFFSDSEESEWSDYDFFID